MIRKRIARYLVEAEGVVWHYPETDDEPGAVERCSWIVIGLDV